MAVQTSRTHFVPVYVKDDRFHLAADYRHGSQHWGTLEINPAANTWSLTHKDAQRGKFWVEGLWIGKTTGKVYREFLEGMGTLEFMRGVYGPEIPE